MANPITLEAAQAAGYNLINGQTETLIIAIFFALIVLLLAALREMHNRGVIAENLREELKLYKGDKGSFDYVSLRPHVLFITDIDAEDAEKAAIQTLETIYG